MFIKMENKYYQKHKEILEKETRERYQNRSDKEKEKRQKKKVRDRYNNLPEENKNYVRI